MPYREIYTALFAEMTAPEDDEGDGLVMTAKGGAVRTYSQADLDAIPALPYGEEYGYVLDIEAVKGKRYGGVSGLYVCASVLTSLVMDVCEGIHLRRVRVLERDPRRRHQGQRVLVQLHQHFPERVPQSALSGAFEWAEDIDHDCYNLDGTRLFREFGSDCELLVHIEAGCQGHSALGPKTGFNHPESGGLVPVSAALADLQYILARKRGFTAWQSAPAQFGYLMENVPGPLRDSQHTKETRMAVQFMNRVYGEPMLHNPALCGDLSSRQAKWWTNLFTTQFYLAHEHLFHSGPYASLTQVVAELTDGRLQPQVCNSTKTEMGGLNQRGKRMRVLPKLLSRPSTVSQRMRSDGTPGAGMLEVVGSDPPEYVPCPVPVRIASLRFWPPQMECLREVTNEAEMIRIVGNVCAPTSLRVMLRLAIGYASQAALQPLGPYGSEANSDRAEEDKRAALQRALTRAAAGDITTVDALDREFDALEASLNQANPQLPAKKKQAGAAVPKPRTVAIALTAAARKKARTDARMKHAVAVKAAAARRTAAARMKETQARMEEREKQQHRDRSQLSRSSKAKNVVSALLTLLLCSALWGPAAYRAGMTAGSQAGIAMEAGFYSAAGVLEEPGGDGDRYDRPAANGTDFDWMEFTQETATAMDARYRDSAEPGECLYTLANAKADGNAEEVSKVPSRMKSAKDGSQHEWQIGAGFQLKREFAEMMDSNLEWYAWGLNDLRSVSGTEYAITLSDDKPIFAKQYHLAHRESEFAESWVKELEEAGLVREVESPYAAPVVVAPKKDEHGKWTDLRYAIDYRRLNAVTVRDQYPTPVPEEILAKLEGAQLFSSMDAQKAFNQVDVAADTQPLLAFHSGGRLMTWNRMPFGGKNSVACWQRVVDEALAGISYAQAFADDIMVWSGANETEHMQRVKTVMDRLHARGIHISPKKCKLGMRRLEFLGHIVSGEGVEPMWDKVEAINNLPAPRNPSEVRSFIGMATYYCRFLDHYSHVKRPLTELTRKDAVWTWGEAQEAAFKEIKSMLTSAPVLRNPDWSRPFILHTDWSKAGVGACLSQIAADGKEYAVAFTSRMNSRAESAFSSYEGEVSAVVYAVQRFRYYLWGQQFKLITDCKAMQWLTSTAKLRSKLARWSLILAEYDFEIEHRAGKDNTVPDLLSRQPAGDRRAVSVALHIAHQPMVQRQALHFLQRQWAAPLAVGWMHGYCWEATSTRFDPWQNAEAIQFLRGELSQELVTRERWAELHRQCSRYLVREGQVWYRTASGEVREVPPPDQRESVVRRIHEENGHLGRDRTHAMVTQRYTWPGIWKTVAAALKSCSQCDRVRASFNTKMDVMQPLPLMGLFYRFHLDAAVNLPESTTGVRHVLVIVEAFSKWIDLVPLMDLTADAVAKAFRERVLARFGRPVEVTTDNGAEYKAEFHQLCLDLGIDHRLITPGHPEANGMAEHSVQVLKEGLRKYVLEHGVAAWPDHLPVIEFGYRTTPERATGFSPYFLVYGRNPVYPQQARALLESAEMDVEDPEAMFLLITERAAVLQETMPVAYERAAAAQHKNAIRYQRVRRRDLPPRQHRYRVGDYVYVSQRPVNTLDVRTTRTILRVRAVLPNGVLELEGSDGRTVKVRMELCAPCHLPNLVTDELGVPADLACSICASASMADPMLLCDRCDRGYHLHCLDPPLDRVPAGQW